jgi:hypothetical protein
MKINPATKIRVAVVAGLLMGALLLAVPGLACRSHGQLRPQTKLPLFLTTAASERSSASTAELQKLIEDLLAAVKAEEWSTAAEFMSTLVLPDYKAWFRTAFGEANGTKLAAQYAEFARFLRSQASAKELRAPLGNGRTQVHVERIQATGDPRNFRDQILSAMKVKKPLYLVRIVNPADPRDFFYLGYFTHVDGRFPSIGKLQGL